VNTPVILQYDATPLVGITPVLGHDTYTTVFTIFDDSGTKLAVAKGAQVYRRATHIRQYVRLGEL
jgi:hypothetical protein